MAPDGRLAAVRSARHEVRVADGRAEQDPTAWWQDTCGLVRAMVATGEIAADGVLGITVTGRGNGAVSVDGRGRPVAPCWSDGRAAAQIAAVRETARRRGISLSSYAAGLAGKLRWLATEEADAYGRLRHALYIKDFIVLCLAGVAVTDPASGPDAPDWPEGMDEMLGQDPTILPRVLAPETVVGTVRPTAAKALGLTCRPPVAVGAHDGVAANVGAGMVRPGEAALTLGTHAVLRAVVAQVPPGARRFYGLLPGRVCVGGNALHGGRSADWLLDLVGGGMHHGGTEDTEKRHEVGGLRSGGEATGRETATSNLLRVRRASVLNPSSRDAAFAALDAAAERVSPGADGALFLPFLGGSVSPHVRPEARGALLGLRATHGQAEVYRAVLEGVAYALRGIRDELAGWGVRPREVRMTGGGSRSMLWSRILAATLEQPLGRVEDAAECRGAAVFLAVGLGLYPDVDAAVQEMVRMLDVVEPEAALAEAYAHGYRRYVRLADAVYAAEQTYPPNPLP